MKIDTIKIDRTLTVKHYFLSNGIVIQRHNTPSSVSLGLIDTNTNYCIASSAWCRTNSEAWRKLKRCPEFPRSRKTNFDSAGNYVGTPANENGWTP